MTALEQNGTTIFEVVSMLALQHHALNLGQGFPDGGFPEDVVEQAARALREHSNQYPPMLGLPVLRQAAALHDQRFYNIEVDWQTQVLVTSGATEALAATLLGLVEPGDEVILFEPLYDAYIPSIKCAGGVPRVVRLQAPGWEIPWDRFEALFNRRTKLVVLNTPNNPTGKVFSKSELERLATWARDHNAWVLCDEVYEHLVFDARAHIPLMTLPNMADRCVRVASAGKTFSLTGWKVGYVVAPPALLKRIAQVHQYLTFTTPPHLQHAVAYGLGKSQDFFNQLKNDMARKRDLFVHGLQAHGLATTACEGTYFVNLDIRSTGFQGDDTAFCREIIEHAGVAAIPLGAFYAERQPSSYVRFCFAKKDTVLQEAVAKLAAHFR